ncbi:hypothetical protein N8600_03875 [Gammaproteobacteria bacterium]|nr:hypothetical protein [Gammaproteobacteria bacterium]
MSFTPESWPRLLVTFIFLMAAFVCYSIGHTPGFKLFFLLGAAFELLFWVRIYKSKDKQHEQPFA